MAVLLMTKMGEEDNFTRIRGEKSNYNSNTQKYVYDGNDPVFEAHRKRDNEEALSAIEEKLEKFLFEAENGFGTLSRREQREVIKSRKKQIRENLALGGFYDWEMEKYIKKINNKLYSIYRPFRKN